jgi:macrolide transport system ATP-binding/permease protein
MPLIAMHKICKFFGSGENRSQVLHDIDFSIEDGEFVAIVGQSGSGKSTLMNILGCLDSQSSGAYYLDGKDVALLSPDQQSDVRGSCLGFIFQRYNLLAKLSAVDNVALPAVYAGKTRETRLARAHTLLHDLGLGEKAASLPSELSGGQQQRVSIARALMNGGRIILADEPTGALDSASGKNVMEILTRLNQQGHTIILVTHDAAIAGYAERVIRISDGRIVSDTRQQPQRPRQPWQKAAVGEAHSRLGQRLDQVREALFMAVQAVLSHKLRSCLTMLGIIIGIAAVVSVVALGKGAQQKIIADISSLGTNTIDIFPGKGFGDREATKIKTLTIADAEILGRQPYLVSSSPNSSATGTLTYRNVALTAQLNGVGANYFDIKGLEVSSGRFFTIEDTRAMLSYVVIDENTKKKLFPHGEVAEGKTLLFNRQPLRIVGVSKKKDVGFAPSDALKLWAPYTTVMHKITGARNISSITVKVDDAVMPLIAEHNINTLLTARHGVQDFSTFSSDSVKQAIESATDTLTLLVAGIAVIALVVGGIGVMNIMLVSVAERTREIGLRMAVGARRSNIMEQFLLEAVLMCLTGGMLGITLAVLITGALGALIFHFSMTPSWGALLLAVMCSSSIGIVFGFMPARNAARLNPIDALSRE